MEAEELIYTVPYTPPQGNIEALCDTICNIEAVAMVETLPKTPLQENAEILSEKLGNLMVKQRTRTLRTYNQARLKQTSTHYSI